MSPLSTEIDYNYFMRHALDQAQKALDAGDFPVGCVLVHDDRVLIGSARTGTAGAVVNEVDHAEINALRQLSTTAHDINPSEITLFCTLEPCLMCFGAILLSGVGEIVYAYEDVMGGGTHCDLSRMPPLYSRNSVSIVPGVLRSESLGLFQAFFSDPAHAYWRDSPLFDYTLAQE